VNPTLRWRPQARQDVLDIYITIAADNESAAERVLQALEHRVNSLPATPRIGVRRPEIANDARILVEGVYVIFYRHSPDTDQGPIREVEIVRILHGRRDLASVF